MFFVFVRFCCLFYNTLNISDDVAPNDGLSFEYDELEEIWEEMIVD
jgi:hypothetical protein